MKRLNVTQNKIIIRAKLKSFTNIFSVCLGVFFLPTIAWLLIKYSEECENAGGFPDLAFSVGMFIFLFITFSLGCKFFFAPLGKKITICGNDIDYQNFFFFHHKIKITAETKIRMGECYPTWSARPELIWKISNHRGKEKIKIHADYFDYKKVNEEFEKLKGYKIEYSRANIKF